MSWEESEPATRLCPCGVGHYTVIARSDDWGRSDERWEMHCVSCRANYALYTYHHNRKGLIETYYGWLPVVFMHELTALETAIEGEKSQLTEYANKHYGERWHNHFNGKPKKTIWRELTQEGKEYPSLSTFYSHARNSSLPSLLNNYFRYREIQTVIRVLELNDGNLDALIEHIQKLEKECEEKHSQARHQAFA